MHVRGVGRLILLLAGVCRIASSADPPGEGADRALSAVFGPKEQLGAWWVPPLPAVADRMQAVHIALLPSGKVLIVNGSSNRNRIENGQTADGIKTLDYAAVNNSSLFDPSAPPSQSGFTRIASPRSPITPAPPGAGSTPVFNDLFCSGHLHLPDGNVLFTGGTQNYYPGEQFLGSRNANLFDWKTETWRSAGTMKDGHWYPSLLPLSDGRIVVVSGLSWDHFSNSSWVEFYDPKAPAGAEWSSVDIRTLPDSPFNTPVKAQRPLPPTGSHGAAAHAATPQSAIGGLDEMDHYPRIAPLPDGRFLITGDGSGGGNVDSTHTYLMKIGPPSGQGKPPGISFARGPERSGYRKTFGTAFMDPNRPLGSYLLIGGLAGSGDINIGPAHPPPDPRIDVVGSAERYSPPSAQHPTGTWSTYEHFLGTRPSDRRIMLVGVLLPNKQVLLMGGGTYGTSSPVFSPLLLTPDQKAASGYTVTTMNPGTQPRLYHTSSLLLPDGRVFLASGNATRAARDASTGQVRLDTVRLPDGTYTFQEKGSNIVSSEIYQAEIFYPPYLFIAGPRPAIVKPPDSLAYGATARMQVSDATANASVALIKLGSMTHAWDMGQRFAELKFTQSGVSGTVSVELTAPDNRNLYPPGYYMLFYVNRKGQPSKAAIVRLG